MRAAVICEFNPFHHGHQYLLEQIKMEYAEEIVCIMSGSFVQRGDIAVTDKYARTKAALEGGADMVVELPTVYAVSGAPIFARSGVQIAAELNCHVLCFGADHSITELYETLSVLDSPTTQEKIAALMKNGEYYPRAVSKAVGEPYAQIIEKPNNILALEYIRACREYGLEPIAIPRIGVEHDSEETAGHFASASKIRAMIQYGEDAAPYTPMRIEKPCFLSGIDQILRYLLISQKPETTEAIAGIGEGLNHRLYRCALENPTMETILNAAKTKRYTMARLRRAALSVCLNITDEMQQRPVPYIRVLGYRREKPHLPQAKSLPLIIDVKRGYEMLCPTEKEIFDIDLEAAKLMTLCNSLSLSLNEFNHGIIKV